MGFIGRGNRSVFAVLAAAAALTACSGQKDDARTLTVDIGATVNAAEPEAARYVPEQLDDVRAKAARIQDAFDRKDYATVVASAPAVLAEAQSLATAAAAEKDRMLKEQNEAWANLAGELPDEMTALQGRIDGLGKKHRKSAQDADDAAAGSRLTEINSLWSKAQAAFATGNMQEAVAIAKDVKSKADLLASTLPRSE